MEIDTLFWFLSTSGVAKFVTVVIAVLSTLIGLITFLTRLGDKKSR